MKDDNGAGAARVPQENYDFNDSENPLPDAEMQRMRQTGSHINAVDESSALGDGNQELLSDKFRQVFSMLSGPEGIDGSSGKADELACYATRIDSSIKWVEVLLKELEKEKRHIDELHRWLSPGSSEVES